MNGGLLFNKIFDKRHPLSKKALQKQITLSLFFFWLIFR